MKVMMKTKQHIIYKKKSGRLAVKDADKNWVNGDEKVAILLAEGLIKTASPAVAEPATEEPPSEQVPVTKEELAAEEALVAEGAHLAEQAPSAEEASVEEPPAE